MTDEIDAFVMNSHEWKLYGSCDNNAFQSQRLKTSLTSAIIFDITQKNRG